MCLVHRYATLLQCLIVVIGFHDLLLFFSWVSFYVLSLGNLLGNEEVNGTLGELWGTQQVR